RPTHPLDLHSFPTRRSSDLLLRHLGIVGPDQCVRGLVVAIEVVVPADDRGLDEAARNIPILLQPGLHHLDGGRVWPITLVRQQPDRKSTRLNSSHVKISYAV